MNADFPHGRLIRSVMAAWALSLAGGLLASGSSAWAAISPTPEEETLRLSKTLSPISDQEWEAVAGDKISQDYEVVKGDTLYEISGRLFGDPKYWPKIWALNNGKITNPHVIEPGQMVAFLPGTGTSLPTVQMGEFTQARQPSPPPAGPSAQAPATRQGRSDEWKNLPRQPWESVAVRLPPNVDPDGFDSRSKITFGKPGGTDLKAIAASEKIPFLGQITGARSEGAYLGIGDTVYIEASDVIQVGDTYTVTQEPELLKARRSDRMGYSYLLMGTIKVIGVRDNLFIGVIQSATVPMYRGSRLIPRVNPIAHLSPIPAENAIEGILMVDRTFSTYTTAQHNQVFVDRGSDDGVRPGMIFRAYQHYDPSNERKVTDADFIIDADVMVYQVSPRFSTGIIINSLSPVTENSTLVLLTDISDLLSRSGIRSRSDLDKQVDSELDELDKLDPGGGLGVDEKRTLKQLEQWENNPPEADQAPPPIDPLDAGGGTDSPQGSQDFQTPESEGAFGPPPSDGLLVPPPGDELVPPPAEDSESDAGVPPIETAPLDDDSNDLPPPGTTVLPPAEEGEAPVEPENLGEEIPDDLFEQ